MLSKLYRQYPVVKDKQDVRDISVPELKLSPEQQSASEVDLRAFCGPIKDQGQTSSCTGHAATSMKEFLYRKYFDQQANKTIPANEFVLSPLYLYYKEREFEGDINQDGGAQMRTSAKMLNNHGCCLLSDYPFNPSTMLTQPPLDLASKALVYKSGAYHRLQPGLEAMKDVLKSGYTFVFGISVYESFEDEYTAKTGTMLIPNPNREKCLGGHALHVVGFSDSKQHLIVQNSWGEGWGDKGYFYMPYVVANNENLVNDCWVAHEGPAWGTPQQIVEVQHESEQPLQIKHEEEPKPEEHTGE